MAEDRRERRITDGSKLLERVDAFAKVKKDARMGAVHDELMYFVDRCLSENGERTFTKAQMTIIKDIAFQIVYLTDPVNRQKPDFIKAIYSDWWELGALKKVGTLATASAFAASAIIGSIVAVRNSIQFFFPPPAAPTLLLPSIQSSEKSGPYWVTPDRTTTAGKSSLQKFPASSTWPKDDRKFPDEPPSEKNR
jgi:hypothetical protein